jgi:hypothetical protein
LRSIAQKVGITHFRMEPIVGNHRDDAARRKGPANKSVVATRPVYPIAAVEEHHHRRRATRISRAVDIQLAAFAVAVGHAFHACGVTGG